MSETLEYPCSARVLGQDNGLSAQAMNVLLQSAGLLEGEPGAYAPTAKAAAYVTEKYHETGPRSGGYDGITWDRRVLDELDLSHEARMRANDAVSTARRARAAAKEAAAVKASAEALQATQEQRDALRHQMYIVGGVVVSAAGAYCAVKAAPHVKAWWSRRKASALVGRGETPPTT